MQAEWRSASMECGEQCVAMAGIEMTPKLCADNWGTLTQEVNKLFRKKSSYVAMSQM